MALVAEYGFSEGSGATTADTSGGGHTLTAVGTPWSVSGKNGPGVAGVAANNQGFSGVLGTGTTAQWTAMLWFYRSGTVGGWGQFIFDGNGFWFEIDSANKVDFNGNVTAATAIPVNTWTHLAVSLDASHTLRLYVNGTLVSTATWSSYYDLSKAATWQIPGRTGDGSPIGVLDEVRLFDTALTQAEISTWMTTAVGGGASSIAGTVAATSDTSGTLSRSNVAGAAAATSAASGLVTRSTMAGATVATSATSGALSRSTVAGTAPAASSTSGLLPRSAVAGTAAAATSATSGTLTPSTITGTTPATSATSGTLTPATTGLQGTVAATSAASGTLARSQVSGTAAATSTTAGTVARSALSSATAAVSAALGALARSQLAGTIAAAATATGTVARSTVSGIAQAISAAAGMLTPSTDGYHDADPVAAGPTPRALDVDGPHDRVLDVGRPTGRVLTIDGPTPRLLDVRPTERVLTITGPRS